MARKPTDTVKSDFATILPDNVIGAISPADLRAELIDMIDSLRITCACLEGPATPTPIATTATPTKLSLLTTNGFSQDPSEIIVSTASSNITLVNPGPYIIDASVTALHTGGPGFDFDFTLSIGGVLIPLVAHSVLRLAESTAYVKWSVETTLPNQIVEVFVWTPDGPDNVTISHSSMNVQLMPDKAV
jgi:hypothetical protein